MCLEVIGVTFMASFVVRALANTGFKQFLAIFVIVTLIASLRYTC